MKGKHLHIFIIIWYHTSVCDQWETLLGAADTGLDIVELKYWVACGMSFAWVLPNVLIIQLGLIKK